jgi:hypothetical protein
MLRQLPVPLSEHEALRKAEELSAKLADRRDVDDEHKYRAAEYKQRAKVLDSEIALLGDEVRHRREFRLVECKEEPDHQASVMHMIRTDTGEVVSSRPMTAEERQVTMFPRSLRQDTA